MIGLVDCNSFFASCEQVFRPDLIGKPVVVLSNNDGCVVSRSREAKKLGIPMGEAFFKIKRLVESGGVHVFSGNYNLYGNLSRRIMRILGTLVPDVEVYSIDEAFFKIPDCSTEEATRAALHIEKTIKQWTGVPVSVGIAKSKTLAKVANETAKKKECGVCILIEEADRMAALENFPVEDVWGVGRAFQKRFRTIGIRTALQLSRIDPMYMKKHHSIVQQGLIEELNGVPCFELDDTPQPKKNILVSRSFGELTSSRADLEQSVAQFARKAASKCRAQNTVASAVQVHIQTNWFLKEKEPYYSNSALLQFPVPTASDFEIVEYAQAALEQIFEEGRHYKRAGVMLIDLVDMEAARSQGFLFEMDETRDAGRREAELALSQVMDTMRMDALRVAKKGSNCTPVFCDDTSKSVNL